MMSLYKTVPIVTALVALFFAVLLAVPPPPLDWEGTFLPLARQKYSAREQPLTNVTVVITGATNGIGLELTRSLSKLGATVVAMGRSPSKLKALQNELPSVQTVRADLDDLESVAQAADQIVADHDTIDVLINNAGMAAERAFGNFTSPQGYDRVFVVNYLSHVLLTEKLIPALAKAKKPTIVQTSSTFHFGVDGSDLVPIKPSSDPIASQPGGSHGLVVFQDQRMYANSKLAQIWHARAIQRQHPTWYIKSVCPAWVGTQIAGLPGTPEYTLINTFGYPAQGWGIASSLLALSDDSLEQDWYSNTRVFQPLATLYRLFLTPSFFYRTGIRDALTLGLGLTCLVLQRLAPEAYTTRSSPESYDAVRGEALYQWSLKAVEPWL